MSIDENIEEALNVLANSEFNNLRIEPSMGTFGLGYKLEAYDDYDSERLLVFTSTLEDGLNQLVDKVLQHCKE